MRKDNYVVVAGTFDMFHVGHKNLLDRASKLGKVIPIINTDEFVEQFKGITPTDDLNTRVDKVINYCKTKVAGTNDSQDLTQALEICMQKYNVVGVVFGDDYDIEKYRKQTGITREWQQEHDIALIQFTRTDNISSTKLRDEIRNNSHS